MSGLVLSRRENEVIRVGDFGKITVLRIRGDKVRIHLDFPESIELHREEVYQAIQAAKSSQA